MAKTTTRSSKAPTHKLFHITSGDKPTWTELAVAWENSDGSLNIRARAGAVLLPGQDYQVRKYEPKDAD